MDTMTVRVAKLDDAPALLDIYAYYVKKTAISFEWEIPSLEEFTACMERILSAYPWLVVERSGELFGYAHASAFVGRAAYAWSAETTIYLYGDARGRGIGERLYRTLEDVLRAQGVLNLNACIGCTTTVEDEYLTNASQRFHERCGFRLVGTFYDSGYKFGRWYDMIWMEKILGGHTADALRVTPFPELSPEVLAVAGVGGVRGQGGA